LPRRSGELANIDAKAGAVVVKLPPLFCVRPGFGQGIWLDCTSSSRLERKIACGGDV
jgi:hypothetical protein